MMRFVQNKKKIFVHILRVESVIKVYNNYYEEFLCYGRKESLCRVKMKIQLLQYLYEVLIPTCEQ